MLASDAIVSNRIHANALWETSFKGESEAWDEQNR